MIARKKFTIVVGLLLLWSVIARPIYDFAWIAAKRGWDAVSEKIARPSTSQLYDDVVALNTQSVAEIDSYIRARRESSSHSPALTQLDYSSPTAFAASTAPLRSVLAQSLCFPLDDAIHGPDFTGVQVKVLGDDDLATYTLLSVPALPGVNVIGTLIEPKNHPAKMPLIIANHGRGGMPVPPANGHITVMMHSDRDLARGAVERGWAVFEPIFVFYGRNYPENIRDLLAVRAVEAGITLPAIEITKLIRAIDYLTSRPEIDPNHVAMIGMSYGGFYTLYTTALEPRIQVAVAAAYFNDRAGVLDDSEPFGFYDWRFSNSLGVLADPHVVALICPRPLQIQSGNQDQLFPLEGARRNIPGARDYYARLHLESKFNYYEFTGRHDFNGEPAWQFIEAVWAGKN